jgi:hypothetical protein
LETQLNQLGLIQDGEVAAPEFLEAGYHLPIGWTNPQEKRTALELAQVQAQQLLDRPQIGVASRDGDNRDRRAALGNALDWRVAAVGLKRVDYLSRFAAEHRSADEE